MNFMFRFTLSHLKCKNVFSSSRNCGGLLKTRKLKRKRCFQTKREFPGVCTRVPPHHSWHSEALEQESFAAVAVPLEDHEVSIVADLPSERPAKQIIVCQVDMFSIIKVYFVDVQVCVPDLFCVKQPLSRSLKLLPLGEPVFLQDTHTEGQVNHHHNEYRGKNTVLMCVFVLPGSSWPWYGPGLYVGSSSGRWCSDSAPRSPPEEWRLSINFSSFSTLEKDRLTKES